MRDVVDTERAERNTKHIREGHRYGQCYIARENAEYKRSPKTKSITSGSMGIRIRRSGNARTASWSDRGIGQPVWQYAYQALTYTAYGKTEGGKSVTSISAGILCPGKHSRRKRTQKGNMKTPRVFWPVSKRGRKRSNEDAGKRTRKCYEHFRRSLKSCLLYTSPSPRDGLLSRMPSSA